MIHLESERPLRLNEVPALFRQLGLKPPNVSTVYRWGTKGTRGRKLELIKAGGVFYTTREAILRFVQPEEQPYRLAPTVKARSTDRQRRTEAAIRECIRLGA